MARVMVPICALRYTEKARFPVEAAEVFYEHDAMEDDAYTYTMRLRWLDEPGRAEIRQALRGRLSGHEAARLINFLDAHGWDVTFFVDAYEE